MRRFDELRSKRELRSDFSMIDYTYQYKTVLDIRAVGGSNWDVFISAFNPSERVIKVFDEVRSARKHWLVHHEY